MSIVTSLVLGLFVLCGFVGFTETQSTSTRGCECEYTRDGRCAYTLWLPSDGINQQCPSDNQPETPTDNISDEVVKELRDNISVISDKNDQNTMLLAQLQSLMLDLQANGIRSNTSDLQASLTILHGAISALTTTVENVQNQSRHYEQHINDLEDRQQKLIEINELCTRRGLLVSGRNENSSVGGYGRYIPDDQITTSSIFDEDHGTLKSRIFTTENPASWCPRK